MVSNSWAPVYGVEVGLWYDLPFKLARSGLSREQIKVLSAQSISLPTSVESIMTFSSPPKRGPVSLRLRSRPVQF